MAAQLELEVRAEGRNMRTTSAPSVWEEGVVWLQVTHKCSCASHPGAVSHCKRHWLRELALAVNLFFSFPNLFFSFPRLPKGCSGAQL